LVEVIGSPSNDATFGKFEVLTTASFREATRVLEEALGEGEGAAFIYTRLYAEPPHRSHFYYDQREDPAIAGEKVAAAYRLQGAVWFEAEATLAAYRERLRDDDRQRRGANYTAIADALVLGDRALAEDRLARMLGQPWAVTPMWKVGQAIADRFELRMPLKKPPMRR
jgi:hypothetical protein